MVVLLLVVVHNGRGAVAVVVLLPVHNDHGAAAVMKKVVLVHNNHGAVMVVILVHKCRTEAVVPLVVPLSVDGVY